MTARRLGTPAPSGPAVSLVNAINCQDEHTAASSHQRVGRPQGQAARPHAALSAEPAGAAGLHRDPGAVRDRGGLFAAALPAQSALPARLHRRRQLHRLSLRSRVLEYAADLAALYRTDRRARAPARARYRAALAAPDALPQCGLDRAAAAADDRARDRGLDVEADDQS